MHLSSTESVGFGRNNNVSATGYSVSTQRYPMLRTSISTCLDIHSMLLMSLMFCWAIEYIRNFFSYVFLCFRRLGPVQTFSDGVVGKLSYDPHSGHIHAISEPSHFMPQYSYNSLSRLGQQPAQKFNHGRSTSTFNRGSEWHSTAQPPSSSFNSGPRSPGSGSFVNVLSWGNS